MEQEPSIPKVEIVSTSTADALREEIERLKSQLTKYEQSSLPPQPAPRSAEIRVVSFEQNSLQNNYNENNLENLLSEVIYFQQTNQKLIGNQTSRQNYNQVLGITEPIFYCKTSNCEGCWIIEEQDTISLTIYRCPICEIYNCVKCNAIHNGMTCDEFRKKKRNRPAFEHDGKLQRQVAQQNTIAAKNPDVLICEKCTCENKTTVNFCDACGTKNEFKPETNVPSNVSSLQPRFIDKYLPMCISMKNGLIISADFFIYPVTISSIQQFYNNYMANIKNDNPKYNEEFPSFGLPPQSSRYENEENIHTTRTSYPLSNESDALINLRYSDLAATKEALIKKCEDLRLKLEANNQPATRTDIEKETVRVTKDPFKAAYKMPSGIKDLQSLIKDDSEASDTELSENERNYVAEESEYKESDEEESDTDTVIDDREKYSSSKPNYPYETRGLSNPHKNYTGKQSMMEGLVGNANPTKCNSCKDFLKILEGVSLRGCRHILCKPCLVVTLEDWNPPLPAVCPYNDCTSQLTDGEINDIITWVKENPVITSKKVPQMMVKDEDKEVLPDENVTPQNDVPIDPSVLELTDQIFHCKKTNCKAFWFIEDEASSTIYRCPLCETYNCVKCEAIHSGLSCEEYKKRFTEMDKRETQLVEQIEKVDHLNVWKCENCTYHNKIDANFCAICQKKHDTGKLSTNDKTWNCSFCTRINPHDVCVCISCSRTDLDQKYILDVQKMQEREIMEQQSLKNVENSMTCQKDGCDGFWIIDDNDDSKIFMCPLCSEPNCVDCKVIHKGISCADFKKYGFTIKNQIQQYGELVQLDDGAAIENVDPFECPICFMEYNPGEGIVLHECLHVFCKECLASLVTNNDLVELKCPYNSNDYVCQELIQEREVKAVVDEGTYKKYLEISLRTAKQNMADGYQCKTVNCEGWWVTEDGVNEMDCPICGAINCMPCQAIHPGQNCQEYQDKIFNENDPSAIATKNFLESMVQRGEAMHCPKCKIIVGKRSGCDWMQCSMCRTEICWVTRGPRWGPAGNGDTTGGCRCRMNGRLCHPNCGNCH